MAIHSDTRTTHTIHIDLPDDVIGKIEIEDDIEVVLHTRAMNKQMTPIKLSWQTKQRLLRDA